MFLKVTWFCLFSGIGSSFLSLSAPSLDLLFVVFTERLSLSLLILSISFFSAIVLSIYNFNRLLSLLIFKSMVGIRGAKAFPSYPKIDWV
jgi:hypothetical protein